ncbi:MAG: hypothetical protein ACOYJ2_06100, partial [Rickettsiales bacterium]
MKDNILIVRGPRTSNPETNENIWLYVTSAASKGYRVTVVGDGTREVSIQEITSAANELKGNTQLIVHAHGGVNKDGDYVLGLNKGNQNSQNSISESSVTIEFSSNAVTGSSFAKSLPKNISSVSYLTCSSGAAPVHEHNPGTSVYMFSNPSAGKAG